MDLGCLLLSHETTPAGDLRPGGRRAFPGYVSCPGVSSEVDDRSLKGRLTVSGDAVDYERGTKDTPRELSGKFFRAAGGEHG